MIARYRILTICLVYMALANFPSIADEITTTFTFGRIEVLTFGQDEWAFLEKGVALTEKDLVRMPPDSLIRLKSNGSLLPTLPGGRELSVGDLILEATQRKNTSRGRRINHEIEHSPVSDILPVGRSTGRNNLTNSGDTTQVVEVTQYELEELRRQLDALPGEIVQLIPQLEIGLEPAATKADNRRGDRYPYPNLHQAQMLYLALSKLDAENLVAHNPVLLYAQLLRHSEIGADLVVNNSRDLLIVFNSGVPLDSAKRVAANQELIQKKDDANTVWISIQAQPRRQNFTTAWYEGSKKIDN